MPVLWPGHRWEDYQVRIIDLNWNQLGTLGTTYKLRGIRSLYGQFKGELTLALDKRDPWAAVLLERQVHFTQVLRDGRRAFEGFQIKLDREDTIADAERWIEFAFLPLAFLLHWRVGTADAKMDWNGPLDDNFKEIVRQTIGPTAPVTPTTGLARIMANFSVQANASLAPAIAIDASGAIIYELIQQYAAAHRVDWDVVFDADFHPQFRTYYPRRGTDRTEGGPGPDSARCIFSDEQGNFVKQSYGQDTSDLKTVYYDRLATIDVAAGATRIANWGLREGIIDSGDAAEMLVALRNADLKEWYKLEKFKESLDKQWQQHFFVGDEVTWNSVRLGYGPRDDCHCMMEFEIDEAGFELLTPTFGKPEPDIRDNLRGGGRGKRRPNYTPPTIWHLYGDAATLVDPDANNAIGVIGGVNIAVTEGANIITIDGTGPAGAAFVVPAFTFGAGHVIGVSGDVVHSDSVIALGITCDDANTVYPLPAGPNRWTMIGGTGCQSVGAVANTVTIDTVWVRDDIDATGAVVTGLHPTNMAGGFTEPVMIGAGSDIEVANWQADAGYDTKLHVEGNIWVGRLVHTTTNSLALCGWDSATENIVHIFDPAGRISKLDVWNAGVRHHMLDADIALASYIRGFFQIRDAGNNVAHFLGGVTGIVRLNTQRVITGDFIVDTNAHALSFGVDAGTDEIYCHAIPYLWPAADGVGGTVLSTDGGNVLSWIAPVPAAHNLLSAQHGDTVVSAMTRGDLVVGTAGGWDDLPIGAVADRYLHTDTVDATWQQVSHTHLSNVNPADHHALVTIGANLAANLLGLAGQALSLDNQAANLVFSGPAAGGAAAPTFRALVAADMPAGFLSYWQRVGTTLSPLTANDDVCPNGATSYLGLAGNRWPNVFSVLGDYTGTLKVGVAGGMRVDIDTNVSGYIQWINAANNRLAYMGDSATDMEIVLENAANLIIRGGDVRTYNSIDILVYDGAPGNLVASIDGATGLIDTAIGYTVATAAANRHVLIGDGAKGVFRALVAADLPAVSNIWTRAGTSVYTTTGGDDVVPNAGNGTIGLVGDPWDMAFLDAITMTNGGWIGIGAAAERIVFDAAGDVTVMGANFGVGLAAPLTTGHFYSGGHARVTIERSAAANTACEFIFRTNGADQWAIGPAWNGTNLNFYDFVNAMLTVQFPSGGGIEMYRAGDLLVYDGGPGNLVASIDGATGLIDTAIGYTVATAAANRHVLTGDGAKGVFRALTAADLGGHVHINTFGVVATGAGANHTHALSGDTTGSVLHGVVDYTRNPLRIHTTGVQLYMDATGHLTTTAAGNTAIVIGAHGHHHQLSGNVGEVSAHAATAAAANENAHDHPYDKTVTPTQGPS